MRLASWRRRESLPIARGEEEKKPTGEKLDCAALKRPEDRGIDAGWPEDSVYSPTTVSSPPRAMPYFHRSERIALQTRGLRGDLI